METTHIEFRTHYRHISHIIDFLTAFNDGRWILDETSQNSIVELTRMLHMLKQTSDHLETFTKFVHEYPDDPEEPEDQFARENRETWPIVEEEQSHEP